MAHTFEHTLDEWATNGTKSAPSSTLKSTGFVGGMKPPASVFNYQWDKIAKAISELQQYALTEDPSGGIWRNLATVATSGNYNDLLNKPELKAVATSGSYNDLSNVPIAAGSYVGQGTKSWNATTSYNTAGRAIALPFVASVVLFADLAVNKVGALYRKNTGLKRGAFYGETSFGELGDASVVNLGDGTLYVNWNGDVSGNKYAWIAIV